MSDYHFRQAKGADDRAPLIFLFHGTGGDENQFFDFAGDVLPGARRVAPRGDVSEGGALRFFRRTGEGVYDMADLARRTEAMVQFVRQRVAESDPVSVLGLGYSNGANILASVQFAAPDLFDRTMLMHPLIPFQPRDVRFDGLSVLITAGQRDPIAPAGATQALATYFERNGAEVTLDWHAGGHEIRPGEVEAIRRFVAS
ncbi:alpha/beta hydrolase [Devosia sp. PTR5]|uniref:Alpha/beta hydrolase n=1 Tax=Devosia oryzisoli TaxID=2774138 RepID=A0A927IU34_9HYPH|nr:alpha/beta hydrolase [Devosia oryzisoli]MBD8067189.1 alpha/beta hydrolase [Devosia oryzisoli]